MFPSLIQEDIILTHLNDVSVRGKLISIFLLVWISFSAITCLAIFRTLKSYEEQDVANFRQMETEKIKKYLKDSVERAYAVMEEGSYSSQNKAYLENVYGSRLNSAIDMAKAVASPDVTNDTIQLRQAIDLITSNCKEITVASADMNRIAKNLDGLVGKFEMSKACFDIAEVRMPILSGRKTLTMPCPTGRTGDSPPLPTTPSCAFGKWYFGPEGQSFAQSVSFDWPPPGNLCPGHGYGGHEESRDPKTVGTL